MRLLTKSLALELGALGYNIRVNSVHPGFVGTDILRDGISVAVEKGVMAGENEAIEMLTMQTPSGRIGVRVISPMVFVFWPQMSRNG